MAKVYAVPPDNSDRFNWIYYCSESHEDPIYIDQNTRIQVLETISELPAAEKDQCAAFIVRMSFPPNFLFFFFTFNLNLICLILPPA